MTNRISEKDLAAAVERLNRNLEGKEKVAVQHANGYINLMNDSFSHDYSLGNTVKELYYQVQLANKMLEAKSNFGAQ
jgi:hypothetical protein